MSEKKSHISPSDWKLNIITPDSTVHTQVPHISSSGTHTSLSFAFPDLDKNTSHYRIVLFYKEATLMNIFRSVHTVMHYPSGITLQSKKYALTIVFPASALSELIDDYRK